MSAEQSRRSCDLHDLVHDTPQKMDLMMRFTWKKLRLPPIACLALAVAAPVSTTPVRGQGRDAAAEARERFIGSWRLLWLEEQGPGGKVHRVEANGLLVFTREGHMSVQVMYRNPPSTASAGQVQYSQGGYEASFGRGPHASREPCTPEESCRSTLGNRPPSHRSPTQTMPLSRPR